MIRVLTPLPVLLPLLGAAAALLVGGRHPRTQRTLSIAVLAAVLTVSVLLLLHAHAEGADAVSVGGWPVPLGIVLVVDRLSALMLVVAATVGLGVLVFAVGQGSADGDEETPISIFHPTFLVLMAGVANAFLAGDLFNLYVGFEILLTASYVLLTLGGSAPRIRAGVTYIVVSLLSSLLFLAAIALIYASTGTVNMAQLAGRLGDLPDGVQLLLHSLLLIAFSIKAAVFPLSAWLPDSYPTAPAPVTAVFAGLLTKVGVYAIIRTQTLLFPGGALDQVLMWAALATMLVGILGAVAQTDIRRILSFTLVSHIGYMVFGIALATTAGLAGAIFYVVHHIAIQTTLFLVAGLIERRGDSTAVDRLGGLAKASPLLAILFFVPAMNLAGIPPLSGFIGKLGLLEAGVAVGGWLPYVVVAAGVITSLLTLVAVSRVWSRAFWRPPAQSPAEDTFQAAAADAGPESGPAPSGDVDHEEPPDADARGRGRRVADVDPHRRAPGRLGPAHRRRHRHQPGHRRPGRGRREPPGAAPAAAGDGRRDRGDGRGDRRPDRAGRAAVRRRRPGGHRPVRPGPVHRRRPPGRAVSARSPTDGGTGVAHQLRHQLPLLVWLVLVWNLLWGTWSWANLISGTVLALAVTLLLPLPPVVGGTRVHPVGLLVFLGTFLLDLVVSGAQVAWQTIRPSGIRHSAIISVELRTDSDLLMTIVAEATALVPGSLVIDMDREQQSIAVHVLHVTDLDDVERRRASVLTMEERVVRAFGSAEEIAALSEAPHDRPAPAGGRTTP